MPELPDVEEFLSYFEEHALEKEIKDVEVLDKKSLKDADEDELKDLLLHDSFKSAERYGKWIIIETQNGKHLGMHFGMTGFLKYTDKDKEPQSARVLFKFNNHKKLYFVDQRKFGRIEIIKDKKELIKDHKLGIDALKMDWDEFKKEFKDKRGMVKTTLMNQKYIAGIGNIYADEILFQSGIDPKTKFSNLKERQLKKLHSKIQSVLKTAIKHHADPDELPNDYMIPHRKKGESWSACHGEIETTKLGGRTTYYCPEAQTK